MQVNKLRFDGITTESISSWKTFLKQIFFFVIDKYMIGSFYGIVKFEE